MGWVRDLLHVDVVYSARALVLLRFGGSIATRVRSCLVHRGHCVPCLNHIPTSWHVSRRYHGAPLSWWPYVSKPAGRSRASGDQGSRAHRWNWFILVLGGVIIRSILFGSRRREICWGGLYGNRLARYFDSIVLGSEWGIRLDWRSNDAIA